MIIAVRKENGKIINQNDLIESLNLLRNGVYLMTIKQISEDRDINSYRKEYFDMLSNCERITGNKKNYLHEIFKEEQNVQTTTNFTIENWIDFVSAFKDYAFKNMDLIF